MSEADHAPMNMRGVGRDGRQPVFFWTLLLILFVMTFVDRLDGIAYLGDVDDSLRAVQITQLLDGKGWYDLSIAGVSMPEIYVSPWSRLVDAPYFVIAFICGAFTSSENALTLAFHIWPSVLLVAFAWFSATTMRHLTRETSSMTVLAGLFSAIAMTYAAYEFTPGRIDHHSMQLVMLAAMSAGLVIWNEKSAILTGVAAVLSLVIGLEVMPFVGLICAGVALSWIFGLEASRRYLIAFGLTLAVLSPVATLAFGGTKILFSVENDVFSAPYIAAFGGFGLISASIAWLLGDRAGSLQRMMVLAVPGAILAVAIAVFMPGILAGPYHMIDPISRALWLERVVQEQSIFHAIKGRNYGLLINTGLQAGLLVFGLPIVLRDWRRRPGVLLVWLLAAFSLLLTIYTIRFLRFPAALVPVFIPALLQAYQRAAAQERTRHLLKLGAASAAVVLLLYGTAAIVSLKHEPGKFIAADYLAHDACLADDYAALAHAPAGRYMTALGMGVSALGMAKSGISVAAIPYHRASPGMQRLFQAFLSKDASERNAALAPFEYLAFCEYPFPVEAEDGTLFRALQNAESWPGLEQIDVAGPRLRVYRINHQDLR